MRLHYLKHVPFENLATIADWAEDLGHAVSATELFSDQKPPDLSELDFLVVMGGPMGVHDTDEYKWLTMEKRFIEAALKAEKPILGICLGAQLIADVLGAKVQRNRHREIGWYPLTKVDGADGCAAGALFPERFFAFHWHGDTFDLPSGSVHLARSEGCENQAFFLPPYTIGLQFHLESNRASIDKLIRNCGDEMTPGDYVQDEAAIHNAWGRIASSNKLMRDILDFFPA